MTETPSERPIARLNYFNGQRLEADDLRLEQEYHLRIQRWLSRSLFSAGVADGYDVHPIEGGKRVLVTPGLALDDLGRAIILVQAVELVPQARYLCVRYTERRDAGGCSREPERILSEPEFLWRREVPADERRELVIAALKLDATCAVQKIESGPRLTAVTKPVTRVRALSFAGEKDIDARNPKVLTFHIRNRRPSSVTLHFSARDFSTLHYSEIGQVKPDVTGGGTNGGFETDVPTQVDPHSHGDGTLSARTETSPHSHTITSKVFAPTITTPVPNPERGIFLAPKGITLIGLTVEPLPLPVTLTVIPPPGDPTGDPLGPAVDLSTVVTDFSVGTGGHTHDVIGKTSATVDDAQLLHKHPITVSIGAAGSVGPTSIRGGNQMVFFTDLNVTVDGHPVTDKILAQLQETNPSVWNLITSFDGSPTHPLRQGTGPIRLDLIDGLSFDPDEMRPHTIVFSVEGAGNGGCIQYNLYVE